uniref:Uncharacterized protein n=1 Tax=Panagrolaimus superbus TaxID=310955 RepID=A0A914YUH9_9BILA
MCINYLCPVNIRDPNSNLKIYAMGSGCLKDLMKNCEINYIDFVDYDHCNPDDNVIANVCVKKTNKTSCDERFVDCLNKTKQDNPGLPFGWDHLGDIEWKPEVDGAENWNETANTVYPIPGATQTTTPLPTTLTATTTPRSTSTITTPVPSTTTSSATTTIPLTTTPTTALPTTTAAPSINSTTTIFLAFIFSIIKIVFN